MISRRDFLKLSMAGGAATFLATRARFLRNALAAQSPQIPLAGAAIPQFVDPLPSLDAIVAGTDQIELRMTEFMTQVLPTGMPQTYV